jgi:hypothetical protein
MSQANDGKSDGSSKSDMFNLPDPDWMIDGRKDPAKAERRREAAKRAAETRARNSQTPGSVSARGIGESRMNTPLDTEVEREASPPIPQPVPPLSFGTVEGGFEGPHALLQPAEIRREPHEPARQAARPHQPSPVEDTNNNRPGADERLLVRSPGRGANTLRETSETVRGEDVSLALRSEEPQKSQTSKSQATKSSMTNLGIPDSVRQNPPLSTICHFHIVETQ